MNHSTCIGHRGPGDFRGQPKCECDQEPRPCPDPRRLQGRTGQRGLSPLRAAPLGFDKPLCASLDGFTLHAATRAGALDIQGREALLRYVLRPPLAQTRLSQRTARAPSQRHLGCSPSRGWRQEVVAEGLARRVGSYCAAHRRWRYPVGRAVHASGGAEAVARARARRGCGLPHRRRGRWRRRRVGTALQAALSATVS